MKTKIKIAFGLLILAAFVIGGASFLMMMPKSVNNSESTNQQASTNSNPTSTDNTSKAAPSQNSEPIITISYRSGKLPCSHLYAEVTITNDGYSDFRPEPSKFFVTVDGKEYGYSSSLTKSNGGWEDKTISNQETYTGVIVFNVVSTNTALSLSYDDANFKIDCIKS